jgi:sec-independent protein translocase protein TatC
VKLGMVTTDQLRAARRYVIVGAFIVAAVLTPPDVLSQFMLAIPLILLYELGIFLSGFLKAYSRKRADEDAAEAAAAAGEAQTAPTGSAAASGASTAAAPAPSPPVSTPAATSSEAPSGRSGPV